MEDAESFKQNPYVRKKIHLFTFFGIAILLTALLILVANIHSSEDIRQHADSPHAIFTRHIIAIRQGNSGPEFYDTRTNQRFYPRGNNYIRLANVSDWGGNTIFYHTTFDSGHYDPYAVEGALEGMHAAQYNVVRVFISEVGVGDKNGGLSSAYLTNVTDFLSRAARNNIFVYMTFVSIPQLGGYRDNPIAYPNITTGGTNWLYMTQDGISRKKRYMQDFIRGLEASNARIDYIFGYSLENEQAFDSSEDPLANITVGKSKTVTTATGTFDMSIPAQRQSAMDSNLVNWINQERDGIREVDPTALVTVGFFDPHNAAAGNRVTRALWAIGDPEIGGSSADFIDLHLYPGVESLSALATNFELEQVINHHKPLIMGEFGTGKAYYPDNISAAHASRDWQVASCKYGFQGWLFWTWDTTEGRTATDAGAWTVLENKGVINGILAPIVRSDPCNPYALPTPTLQLGRIVPTTPAYVSPTYYDAHPSILPLPQSRR